MDFNLITIKFETLPQLLLRITVKPNIKKKKKIILEFGLQGPN